MTGVPQVDFYILPDSEAEQRALFACRLIEKVYRLRHRIYVHHDDEASARALDELLWRHQAASFIPHDLQGEPDTEGAVRLIWDETGVPAAGTAAGVPATGALSTNGGAVLINLATTVPAYFERFARVTEIVVQEPSILAATRTAWRYYQQRGCTPERHDLRTQRERPPR